MQSAGFQRDSIISHMPEKCNSTSWGFQGAPCDNCEGEEAVRAPVPGMRPCPVLSLVSHHLPPAPDFNVLDMPSPHGRECARRQLLLITPHCSLARGTESGSEPQGEAVMALPGVR